MPESRRLSAAAAVVFESPREFWRLPTPVLQSCAGRIGATVRALLADLLRLGASRIAMPTLPGDIVRAVTGEEARRAGRPFVVSIEGNIGSGKSTMLKYFEKFQDVELVPEPVAEVGPWPQLGVQYSPFLPSGAT